MTIRQFAMATAVVCLTAMPAHSQAQSDAAALPISARARTQGTSRLEVERTNQAFVAAFKTGNADAAASLVTADMVTVEPDGQRHEGRSAYAALATQYLSLFTYPDFTVSIEGFGASGSIAWASGKESGTFVDKKSGKPTSLTVQYLAIYERQADGKYLMRYLQETSMPAKSPK
jgi:ketosteroid isomerase-like protein